LAERRKRRCGGDAGGREGRVSGIGGKMWKGRG